jgi:hypothetical protein
VGKVWTDTIDTISARWRDLMQLMSHENPLQRNTTKQERDREKELKGNLPADKNSILEQGGVAKLSPHKQRLKEIEDERKAGHAALNQQVQAISAAREGAVTAAGRDLNPVLDLTPTASGMSPAEKSMLRGRGGKRRGGGVGASAQAGFTTALMQVKGVGGEDVRTSSGFRGIMQSLRQQQSQNPLLTLGQQQLNLQEQEARDIRQLRINSDKQKVRT